MKTFERLKNMNVEEMAKAITKGKQVFSVIAAYMKESVVRIIALEFYIGLPARRTTNENHQVNRDSNGKNPFRTNDGTYLLIEVTNNA